MRIFLVTIVFLLQIKFASGQVIISLLLGDVLNTGKIEFGLEGGANLTDISGLDGKAKTNFNLGFYFDIKLKNQDWMVHTGVIVKSNMGIDELPVYSLNNPDLDAAFEGGEVYRQIKYFNVPIMMKYKSSKHIFVQGGFQLGLRTKAKDKFSNKIIDKEDLTFELDISDDFHRIDAGLAAGIGYRLLGGNGMNINLNYYYGLIDITISDSAPDQFNRSLYLTLGIPIGAGKAEAKKEGKETEGK
ncbi:MAG: PorT family protein [Cyclobacteriaceae bacterium]|nr:PorT family protein [Cyclobacteriaceae bacterium]